MVLFNSWLWETKISREAQKIDKMVNSAIGKFLYLNMNFSPKVLFKKGFANSKNLSKEVHKHYIKPFPNVKSRKPLLMLAKSLVGSSDWYQEQWYQIEKWKVRLPKAEIRKVESGHFVQEEKPIESIEYIRHFMHK